ncbi:exodeoxyribonuclease VII large subunit [Streptococcus chenjunshii]|uniref:Exodeoxyribonuclease 7 large subunit n=1 Tax=Streptococcus chenjunshii TaxID=2173853 RepID=A0A372KJM2_9STRE|nr:exodeoxyribonuclease VII large subunit [Streptococcus chenjunshii]AXQ78229.1 exodeoxyribonuclease VII large subunit [Streptococcus chenjunshii]RFU50245.1 exodeoxyribonuclease VII large subunit [Streptococcus chenjunshii]RFU52457.1 exodeoxyribonuclease VII large subunit [Streptococcus chenjunshii]
MSDYLSVSSLTRYLKLKFDRDPYLERVYLTGQVSNFRKRPAHQYFSLKDDKAVIQATMWASQFKKLGFDLEEGMQLNVIGRVQLYEPGGSYSIIIEKAEPDGLGALAVQFEQLKKKLTAAGYFAAEHKQSLPQFVKKIGVVTSPSGAVIRDIITTVSRRFPGVEILLFPTKVQGEGASQDVARNIALANERSDLDLLIVGRGGGSIEDLWAFNEEVVVEAIFASHLPVISSVGHETDTTLADFAADRRAATPTAAAELATPVTKADLLTRLSEHKNRAYQAVSRQIRQKQERLGKLAHSVVFRQPERLYDRQTQQLDRLTAAMTAAVQQQYRVSLQAERLLNQRLRSLGLTEKISRYQEQIMQLNRLLMSKANSLYEAKAARLEKAQSALLSLDTKRIVARGYALIHKDEKLIVSTKTVKKGDRLQAELRDGQLEVEVKDVK